MGRRGSPRESGVVGGSKRMTIMFVRLVFILKWLRILSVLARANRIIW